MVVLAAVCILNGWMVTYPAANPIPNHADTFEKVMSYGIGAFLILAAAVWYMVGGHHA